MNPALQQFLAVFAATLPLVGVIGWAAFAQNARFDAMDRRLGRIEYQLDELGKDLKSLGLRTNEHETRITVLERQSPRLVTK